MARRTREDSWPSGWPHLLNTCLGEGAAGLSLRVFDPFDDSSSARSASAYLGGSFWSLVVPSRHCGTFGSCDAGFSHGTCGSPVLAAVGAKVDAGFLPSLPVGLVLR